MRRTGLLLLVAGLLAVALAYGLTFAAAERAAPWWLAAGTTAVLAGLAMLGAARGRRATPRLRAAMLVAFGCVAAGLSIPLALPAPTAATPLLLGLPRPTAILLLLVGAVPLLLLPLAYAAAFEREVLGDDDLAALGRGVDDAPSDRGA